jgi:hypothetical protein
MWQNFPRRRSYFEHPHARITMFAVIEGGDKFLLRAQRGVLGMMRRLRLTDPPCPTPPFLPHPGAACRRQLLNGVKTCAQYASDNQVCTAFYYHNAVTPTSSWATVAYVSSSALAALVVSVKAGGPDAT